jgi:hypothetical protein
MIQRDLVSPAHVAAVLKFYLGGCDDHRVIY